MTKKVRLSLLLLLALIVAACSSPQDRAGEDTSTDSGAGYEESVGDSADWGEFDEAEGESGRDLIGEKVIRTVFLEYETLDFEVTTSHVMETVSNHDAYVEYSSESSYQPSGISQPAPSSQQYRTVDYILRVPTESLTTFLNDLEGMEAYKVREELGSEDVTQSYRDTESRIGVLQNKEDRLNELLEQAESIEDILQIENQLSSTIQEREVLQSRLDEYDQLIDYTVVNLSVWERPRIAHSREERASFLRRASDALVDSFFAFYYWIQDALIWLIYAFPFLLIVGIIAGIIYWVVKRRRK